MQESLSLRFLYRTKIGRVILKGLVNPSLSKAAAHLFSSKLSARVVPNFIRKNNIDMKYYQVPKGGYKSFNDFFTRRMKEEYIRRNEGDFVCPSDGLLTVCDIDEDSVFYIKHTEYSLKQLLKNEYLADSFKGGTAFIFRLTPAHYHRYIFSSNGIIKGKKRINGLLHSVRPICHEHTDVFIQNSREYVLLETEKLGRLVQMEVGALLVGKISNFPIEKSTFVTAGQDKGFFEYGGSSIVVLTSKKVELAPELKERKAIDGEIPVHIGEALIN